MNWVVYRQLAYLAVHPRLGEFMTRSSGPILSADISAFSEIGNDHGFGLFWYRTRRDLADSLPTIRMAVAKYLAHECPRLEFLFHLLVTEGTLRPSRPQPRFLVYANWPFTRWLVEMFLSAIGIDFVVMRAGMGS